jgi:hypothetical protein
VRLIDTYCLPVVFVSIVMRLAMRFGLVVSGSSFGMLGPAPTLAMAPVCRTRRRSSRGNSCVCPDTLGRIGIG